MSKAPVNKAKVLSEMFGFVVYMNDCKQHPGWKRLSPTTREAHLIMEDMWRAMMEAVRQDHNVVFELVTYRQQLLDGVFFEAMDSMTPQEPDETPPETKLFDDKLF